MDTSPADHRPHDPAHVADRIRGRTNLTAANDDIAQALQLLVNELRQLDEPDGLAEAVLVTLVGTRTVDRLPAYVRTACRGDFPSLVQRAKDHGGASRPGRRPGPDPDLAAAVAQLRQQPPCPHGYDGGDQPHPTTGTPLCPMCRRAARATA